MPYSTGGGMGGMGGFPGGAGGAAGSGGGGGGGFEDVTDDAPPSSSVEDVD